MYPSQLGPFLGLDKGRKGPSHTASHLFKEPLLNLDTLKIHTDYWITRSSSSSWRHVAEPEDVQYGMPAARIRWLVALCGIKGFKQLDLVWAEQKLLQEYCEREERAATGGGVRFVQEILDKFEMAMRGSGSTEDGEARDGEEKSPEWTLWHQRTPGEPFHERITALRTAAIGRHGHPQWKRGNLQALREGRECVFAWPEGGGRGKLVPKPVVVDQQGEGPPEVDLRNADFWEGEMWALPVRRGGEEESGGGEGDGMPDFHVGELLGEPGMRQRVCERCVRRMCSV